MIFLAGLANTAFKTRDQGGLVQAVYHRRGSYRYGGYWIEPGGSIDCGRAMARHPIIIVLRNRHISTPFGVSSTSRFLVLEMYVYK
jgi:hypothetical protein